MSVNEVKLQKAAIEFQVRGTGPPSSRTFAIGNEDHTIGNALRHVLIQNAKVGFAGYSVPHPADPIVHIRVQANEPTTAIDALKESCETLHKQCDAVLAKLEERLPYVKQDKEEVDEKIKQFFQEDFAVEEMDDAVAGMEDEDEDMEEI